MYPQLLEKSCNYIADCDYYMYIMNMGGSIYYAIITQIWHLLMSWCTMCPSCMYTKLRHLSKSISTLSFHGRVETFQDNMTVIT